MAAAAVVVVVLPTPLGAEPIQPQLPRFRPDVKHANPEGALIVKWAKAVGAVVGAAALLWGSLTWAGHVLQEKVTEPVNRRLDIFEARQNQERFERIMGDSLQLIELRRIGDTLDWLKTYRMKHDGR